MKNYSINNFKLSTYFKKYKLGIFLYIITSILASACNIFFTLYFAKTIELITLGKYQDAIFALILILICIIIRRFSWYSSSLIYQKYANKIMADLNLEILLNKHLN